ncbi:hypothetical protein MTO96_040712 [Rhipicephalus appendiculatus]
MLYCDLSWTEIENLFLGYRAVKPRVSKSNGGHIIVDTMNEETFRRQFRFSKDDLPALTETLKIPTIRSSQGVTVSGQEALLMGLCRLAYPNRWWDLEPLFGRHSSALSNIVSQLLGHIDSTFGHLLADVNNHSWLTLTDLEQHSEHTSSIVLMAIVDSNCHYVLIDVGAEGRQSDGGVLKNSKFGKKLLEGTLCVFPPRFLPELWHPMPSRCAENAFGITAARWRVLLRTINLKPKNVDYVCKAACALHNFIMKSNAKVQSYEDREDSFGNVTPGRWREGVEGATQDSQAPLYFSLEPTHARNFIAEAADARNLFTAYFCSSFGELAWQWCHPDLNHAHDTRRYVVGVDDIRDFHPKHETGFDGKAVYVVHWVGEVDGDDTATEKEAWEVPKIIPIPKMIVDEDLNDEEAVAKKATHPEAQIDSQGRLENQLGRLTEEVGRLRLVQQQRLDQERRAQESTQRLLQQLLEALASGAALVTRQPQRSSA